MSRWKGLPESLDHRVRYLIVQLRRLKDHSGLSLAALAARTSYSKSSWERYLNGKKLPPREAVEALARICEADTTRLLALHEVAAQAWHAERPQAEPEPEAGPGAEAEAGTGTGTGAEAGAERDEAAVPAGPGATAVPVAPVAPAAPAVPAVGGVPAAAPAGRQVPLRPLVLGALAVLVMAGAALLVARLWEDASGIGSSGADAVPTVSGTGATLTFTHRPGEAFPCSVQRRAGALYAGHSSTGTAILDRGATGWDVVEAQCLLHRQGYDPGVVDGIVGGKTLRAVKRLQARAGLPTDGIVGPDTWKVLRR
ncbi:Helix-turn-helix domain-containing protein [Streptomyces sp. KS_16]|uniref:helix-turn-helix domain-containing protein n=1 Tax=unclassified Streptomyces TaxID=2593676 RepID=UPI000890304F|nr:MULTISPECIES: peptidoglycan-binding protein [unclassified Streptomyces]PBC84515.1 helix-turn-helix protein [Streptomyces sp. 2321.6]SDR29695.1 Helix-turn-helix domain-containing protein [Streptomyces sp. KS_16]SNC70598.1 Helix-turn-helix domain-containing protein [Streptomyces sp. 2114.4]